MSYICQKKYLHRKFFFIFQKNIFFINRHDLLSIPKIIRVLFIKNFRHFIFKIILFNYLIFLLIFIRNKNSKNNIITNLNKNTPTNNACILIKEKLNNRKNPLEFENELNFFIELISCKIPFLFIRFGDGENKIMKGIKLKVKVDKWHWDAKNEKFQKSLIESSSICLNNNSFIGLSCKNWIKISESILSFSKCSSAK